MKVDIIINCYNSERFIGRTLESLKDLASIISVLIIDNLSADKTVQIAEKKLSEFGINYRIIELDVHCGLGEARKKSLAFIRSEYFIFVDSDDLLEPTCFKSLVMNYADQSDSILVCRGLFIDGREKVIGQQKCFAGENLKFEDILNGPAILFGSVLFPRKLISQLKELPIERLQFNPDFLILTCLSLLGYKFLPVNKFIIRYRVHSDSLTNKLGRQVSKDLRMVYLLLRKMSRCDESVTKALSHFKRRAFFHTVRWKYHSGCFSFRLGKVLIGRDFFGVILFVGFALRLDLFSLRNSIRHRRFL